MPVSRSTARARPKTAPKRAAPKKARRAPAPLDPSESLSLRLGFLIHDVSRLRRNAFDRLMRPLGVTRSQWWVLAYLSRDDGMTQTELANMLDVGKVTLGGLIDRLEAAGWVARRNDSVDRRLRRIFLAPKSAALFKQMHAAEGRLGAQILKGIHSSKAEELSEMLAQMKHNLIEIGASAGQNGETDILADD